MRAKREHEAVQRHDADIDSQVANLRSLLSLMIRAGFGGAAGLRPTAAIAPINRTQPILIDDIP